MDIFTDASLNDHKKIAGVGAVFVPAGGEIICHNSYCSTRNIQTAELFAIAVALRLIRRQKEGQVRVVSDSMDTLKTMKNIFRYTDQHHIREVDDLMQKRILYNLADTFSRMPNVEFLFQHVAGHQRKPIEGSDGYYNMLADEEADVGRMKGETNFLKGITYSSSEEGIIYNQSEIYITAPRQIQFVMNDNPEKEEKPKRIARHKDERKQCIRKNLRQNVRKG